MKKPLLMGESPNAITIPKSVILNRGFPHWFHPTLNEASFFGSRHIARHFTKWHFTFHILQLFSAAQLVTLQDAAQHCGEDPGVPAVPRQKLEGTSQFAELA